MTDEAEAARFAAQVVSEADRHGWWETEVANLARAHVALLARLERVEGENVKLRGLLAEVVDRDNEECRYDHNEFCQSHYASRPCLIERCARATEGT